MSAPAGELGKQAIQSTLWAYGSFVSGKFLVFISTVILARLLLPEQFGQMGYCLIAIQYLDILNGFGVGSALISRRDRIEEAANAALMIGLASSIVLFALAWVSAPLLAQFFNDPLVTDLFRVLALVIPLSAIGTVPSALIQRGLRFKAKFVPDVGRSVAKGVLSVVLAWQGFGVWSLVLGQVAGEVTATVIFLALARWRPTRSFDSLVTRDMLRFGSHIILVGITGALIINLDYLIVGRVLGAAALGYYTLAYRVPELLIRNTNYVIGKVAYPLLSQLQEELEALRGTYTAMLRYVSLITIPAGVGLALVAEPFIHAFYTPKWDDAVPVMQLIAIALAISSVGFLPGIVYKAINRPEILNQLSWIKLLATTATLLFAVRWGIVGIAAGQLALALLFVALDTWMVRRVLRFPVSDLTRAVSPALLASLVMAAAVLALRLVADPVGVGGLALIVVFAILVFGATLVVTSRETVTQARTVLRSALARS